MEPAFEPRSLTAVVLLLAEDGYRCVLSHSVGKAHPGLRVAPLRETLPYQVPDPRVGRASAREWKPRPFLLSAAS